MPMQKSATAKLHIRNFETVRRKCEVAITTITRRLPMTAESDMNQTGILSIQLPIKSSQGLKASGAG